MFFSKNEQTKPTLLLWNLRLICFRWFFGGKWRHQKDISKLSDQLILDFKNSDQSWFGHFISLKHLYLNRSQIRKQDFDLWIDLNQKWLFGWIDLDSSTSDYLISSYSFRANYSSLNLEIQRSQYINVRKLFKGGKYMRKYGIHILPRTLLKINRGTSITYFCLSVIW